MEVAKIEFDQLSESIPVLLLPPDTVAFENTEQIVSNFMTACNQIMLRPADFTSTGTAPEKLSFLQMALEVNGQRIYPYFLGVRIQENSCSPKLSFAMPTLSDPFSKHHPDHEFLSVLHTWGMKPVSISYETGTKGRQIIAEFSVLESFERDLKSLNAATLCIHALANLESTAEIPLLGGRLESFKTLMVQITEQPTSSVSFQKILGSAEFAIIDGRCAEKAEK